MLKQCDRSHMTFALLLKLFMLSAFTMLICCDEAATEVTELWETVIYEGNVLHDKSYGFFKIEISERYYKEADDFSIKVVPE